MCDACRKQLAAFLAPLVVYSSSCVAADLPPSPPTGACTDCIGELNGTLNACTLNSASCVSSQNEDEDHFMAPWQYSSSTEAAVASLVEVATGSYCLSMCLLYTAYMGNACRCCACRCLCTYPTVCCCPGGEFEPALLQQPFGISRTDAVSFIVRGFQAALTGEKRILLGGVKGRHTMPAG